MSRILLPEEYPYFYETHMHTAQGSACASSTGAEIARAYKEAGYTGIIITDHNWYGNTAIRESLSWAEWIRQFTRGYEEAAAWGEQNGLSVFWGYEACYEGNEFLIYGLSPEFLKEHPQLKDATVKEQYEIVKQAGGMVVHAHPYREASYIPKVRFFPGLADAVEVINAGHYNRFTQKNQIYNVKAIDYAKEQQLPMTAGSDMHCDKLFGGGMAFTEKLTDLQHFCRKVLEEEDYLLTDGVFWYTKQGEPIHMVNWD